LDIQRGDSSQSAAIAELIFASEPILLSFLFGGDIQSKAYLQQACNQAHGQFSGNYHWVASQMINHYWGYARLWFSAMPTVFQQGTIFFFITDFLGTKQIIHLLAYKEALDLCFPAPAPHQVCLGHMSIAPSSRRKGVASALITHVLNEAKESNSAKLF